MKNKLAFTAASLVTVAALSGCAPGTIATFPGLRFSGNQQQQTAAQVIPGIVTATSPANVSVGFLSSRRPGVDIVVRTFTQPPEMLSVVQPIKSVTFSAGETVGVVTRNGQTRVIPLPGYTPGGSTANTLPLHTGGTSAPGLTVHLTTQSPFSK